MNTHAGSGHGLCSHFFVAGALSSLEKDERCVESRHGMGCGWSSQLQVQRRLPWGCMNLLEEPCVQGTLSGALALLLQEVLSAKPIRAAPS